MSFSSLEFLFLFLPVSVVLYYVVPVKLKNLFLLAASLAFYAVSGRMVLLLLLSLFANWIFGLIISSAKKKAPKGTALVCSLAFNIGVLFCFKYLADVWELAGGDPDAFFLSGITLPLGISFFTFRAISYCADVFWGMAPASRKPAHVFLYISFFPQVTMGPITRYSEFVPQLEGRRHLSAGDISDGIKRIISGLAKKVILSNTVGVLADDVFAIQDGERAVVLAWLGIIAYLLQLYFDFSGYSDIAIGLGRLFGFETPENFNFPYISRGAQEYWTRWHITLGTWIKNYVYTPVFRLLQGKNFPIRACDILALVVSWVAIGIWHGPGIMYFAHGMFWLFFIILERLVESALKKRRKRLHIKKKDTPRAKVLSHVYFALILIFGQLMFNCATPEAYSGYVRSMLGGALADTQTVYYLSHYLLTIVIGILFCFPVFRAIRARLEKSETGEKICTVFTPFLYLAIGVLAVAYAMGDTYQSFIYFQF